MSVNVLRLALTKTTALCRGKHRLAYGLKLSSDERV